MKKYSAVHFAVFAAIAASSGMAETRGSPELLVMGPVESVDLVSHTATVLGQRIAVANADALAVGNSVSVYVFPVLTERSRFPRCKIEVFTLRVQHRFFSQA